MKLVAMGVSETGLIPQTSIFVHGENDDNSLHFGLPCFPKKKTVLPGVKFIGPPKMDGLPSKTIIDHEHNQLFQSPISRVYVNRLEGSTKTQRHRKRDQMYGFLGSVGSLHVAPD